MERKNENENNYEMQVLRICGYLIFKKTKKANKVACSSFRLFCRKIHHIFFISKSIYCCKSFAEECGEWFTCLECKQCCQECPCCQCCLCCKEEINESNQVNYFFCYCFKVQGFISWFCDLLSKKQLIALITSIILLEIQIIGFEKKLKRNLNEDTNYIFIYIIAYFIMGGSNEMKKSGGYNSTFSFVIILATLFSGFSYFGGESLRNFTAKYLEPNVIAMVKFYYFYIMNHLIILYDSNNVDLLSNSMVVSFFLILYNLISYLFIDIVFSDQKYEKSMMLFQFIFGILNLGCSCFVTSE